MQGKKVLLIDADPQGDLTTCLGWRDTDSLSLTLTEKLQAIISEQEQNPFDGILHHKEKVDLVPSNLSLSSLEMTLVTAMSRESVLKNYLSLVKDKYDYVLIDCMPSLGMITFNALTAADSVITSGSLNTFAKHTNVDTNNRLICYDILDLGKQLMPIGMLVVLDSILNRITQNRAKGRNTFIFIDEIYLLFQHEYSANFLFTLWKRVRKYGAYATGITQNVDDLLQSHTARTMLANSEFIIMLNQASTDRLELAKLLNISDLQMSYITNVEAGHGLIKVGSSLVPFANKFPKNTKLYKLMTTKPGESA